MAVNGQGMLPGGQRRPGKTRATRAEVLENRRKAITLRSAGATYDEIAKALGYADKSNARKAVLAALEDQVAESVHDLRTLEGARLDRLQRVVWADALGGDPDAIDRCLRIMDRRARLYGLNAPTKIEVTDEMDREIAELAAALEDPTWAIETVGALADNDIDTEVEGR